MKCNEPKIEEQIEKAAHQDWCRWWNHGDFCSCGAVSAIEKPVPVEPAIDVPDEVSDYINRINLFIRNLQSALQRAQEDRDEARKNYQFMVDRAADEKLDGYRELGAKCAALEQRAEKAEAELKRAQEKAADDCKLWRDRRDEALTALEKAEAINRRMVEMLKDPTYEMCDVGQKIIQSGIDDPHCIFTNMSAELLKEVEK